MLTRKIVCFGLTLSLLGATLSINFAQTTYYVASTGNDANDGQSVTKPIQSLAKVNSLTLRAGDVVLFHRGDTFQGTLLIRQSGSAGKPIRFDAYGNGRKPVLSGSVSVNNWINSGTNRWQASCPTCGTQVTGVYRNGVAQPLGRYPNPDAPNRGSLTIQDHRAMSQLTSQEPLLTDWTGAEVVLRPTYWIIDRATINQQHENTLTLTNPSTYHLTDGWGFFIQNHPATIDQPGEWYYNPGNKTLQLYANQSPDGQLITATAVDRVIDMADAAFVTIQNLHITQARTTNLYASNVSNLTLVDTDFTESGTDGVVIQGSGTTILVDRCTITNNNNNGFFIGPYQNVTFRRSAIRHTGLLPGRGRSGDGQFTGFQSFATQNTLIENNVIDSTGYVGISVQNNTTIRQNLIASFCMTKSDGGGIYLWNGLQLPMHNILVESNIIRNGIGTFGGLSDNTVSGAHGIFLDDCVQEVSLIDNTIADCQGLGIYLHSVSNVRLLRNTCFNNSVGQLILYNYDSPCPPRQNSIRQNILAAKTATQAVVGYISGANDLNQFGSMDHNYYVRPFNDLSVIRAVYNRTIGSDLNLSQWQAQFGQDMTSKSTPITYKDYTVASLSGTNRIRNSFDSSIEDWDIWSPYSNGRVTWYKNNQSGGGSLQVAVSDLSHQSDSYLLTYKKIQAVAKSNSYLLRFDATTPTPKKLVVFLRQRQAPYQDLTRRYEFMAGPAQTSYEFALTPAFDEDDALLTFQLPEDNQPVWFDNVRLQEAVITPANPDEMIRLVYNPTTRDSTIGLSQPYRDVKNHYYIRQVTLKPFTSVLLLRDPQPPVDIRLSLRANQTSVKISDTTLVSLSLYNETKDQNTVLSQVQWTCRLPANLVFISGSGLSYKDSLLTGTVQQLRTDTTFLFTVKATVTGQYNLMAEVTESTYADPDSTPDSGLDDGEDDTAMVTLLARERNDIVTATDLINSQIEKNLVYPNPSSSTFTLVVENDISAIRVIDLLGQERLVLGPVHRGQIIQFGQQLPSTYYLLHIQYKSGEQRVVKLVKL